MELGELVTSGTGAALVQGSLVESHHHGVSIFLIFFFSHTEISRVMSSQSLRGFLFVHHNFLGGGEKKPNKISLLSQTLSHWLSQKDFTLFLY